MVEKLREAIRRSGRSLYDVAKDAGVGYAVLHRVYHGERDNLTVQTFERLAGALGLSVELRPAPRRKGRS